MKIKIYETEEEGLPSDTLLSLHCRIYTPTFYPNRPWQQQRLNTMIMIIVAMWTVYRS